MANKIIIAMFLGLLIGFTTQFTLPVVELTGQGFVMLMQMTALPYISVSLIYGIGSMSRKQGKQLIKFGGSTLLILSTIVLVFIGLSPLAFPDWSAAAFYSASNQVTTDEQNILELFLPANPFNAYAQAIIPAVVIFSIFVGLGFIGIESKRRTLYIFKDLREALTLVTNFVMKFAPIGVFAIALHASATIKPDELDGLMVYIATAACVVLLLSFVVLPLLVAIITPLTYKQVVLTAKDALITAFATGSIFIVLPLIAQSVRKQLFDYAKLHNDAKRIPSVIVPISFSLPIGGKLLAILFVLFAGWFSGESVHVSDYPELMIFAVMQLFGSSMIAVPNLLDNVNISASMFDLFVVAEQLIISRLGALLSVMFITVMSLLVTLLVLNKVKFYIKPFTILSVSTPIATALIFLLLSLTFNSISHPYQGYEKFINRDLLLPSAKASYLKEPANIAGPFGKRNLTLNNIKQRGIIRMGYYRDSLPYAFHNKDGELVGLDIELGHLLAQELGVNIEFVRIYRTQTKELLSNGYLDIVSGIPVTPKNLLEYTLTSSYTAEPFSFLVRDKDRRKFTYWKDIIDNKALTIGIPEAYFYEQSIQKNMPNNKVWELSTPRLMFKKQGENIDAMMYGAAGASAWTLLYPDYAVVMPKPLAPAIDIAFPVATGDLAFERFISHWIAMKKRSKTIDALFAYWIEGKEPNIFIK
ncbi:cation:dicarboxylase symporter family transporter [Thalassotalea nanhaiensis]|uniref:Cation:dicarboxylase symporter family transporter n=1 Tax=Thalassotalea nanhaiensis TaxID=3065648 RepID=A0ABY9TGF7_9GAMM|nr:cation:dicarboxylase symporter family transporter [Colwelliaceae bacterium SQ345]